MLSLVFVLKTIHEPQYIILTMNIKNAADILWNFPKGILLHHNRILLMFHKFYSCGLMVVVCNIDSV